MQMLTGGSLVVPIAHTGRSALARVAGRGYWLSGAIRLIWSAGLCAAVRPLSQWNIEFDLLPDKAVLLGMIAFIALQVFTKLAQLVFQLALLQCYPNSSGDLTII